MKSSASAGLLVAALLLGCVNVVTIDSPPDAGPPRPVVCGGRQCQPGEQCCLLTGRCFDPTTERGTCTVPPDAGVASTGGGACVSNADCGSGQFCRLPGFRSCLGVGTCAPRTGEVCIGIGGRPSDGCPVCGCDGVTYFDGRAAGIAGVNSHGGRCGEPGIPRPGDAGAGWPRVSNLPCGFDSQCPAGSACCAITGYCYDATTCPDCCGFAPANTGGLCRHDLDCPTAEEFCDGAACDSLGACSGPARGCGGALAMVCGCNGTTYSNECWARSARTRVARPGACE